MVTGHLSGRATPAPDPSLSMEAIRVLLMRTRTAQQEVQLQMRVRRLLINRDAAAPSNAGAMANYTGTVIPAPFDKTSLAIRTMVGEPAKAAQHYASRLSANRPDIEVVPTTARNDITETVAKLAGAQERMDNQLWIESGGREAQWTMGWAMSVGGVGYYLDLPRDATFGLPDRIYYEDKSDDEIAQLKESGKLSPTPIQGPTGQLIYAEGADVWAARRRDAARNHTIAGNSLFVLNAYPRDMVLRERDRDGLKWAAIVEEIPGHTLGLGTDLAVAAARRDGIPEDDVTLYGLFLDEKGAVVGGIVRGGPPNSNWRQAVSFTLVRFFTRTEQVVILAGPGAFVGGKEIYRGRHGCTEQGVPVCPVVEVPFMRTDVEMPGQEFSTALNQVFAYVPLLNQLQTLMSNATAFNLVPRWVIELPDGTVLRGEDGEPVMLESGPVPGLDPKEAAAYPGKLVQLTIDTAKSVEMLKIYLEELEKAMPSSVTSGVSGAAAAAWQVRQLIQQAQEILRQPVDNHTAAVASIVRRRHGWLRDLDTPIWFYPAPGHRKDRRRFRSLIEFDPRDLTDSITVTQELDTPEEATIRLQEGLELWKSGLVTLEQFFRDYAKTEDARQSVIDYYAAQIVGHVMGGIPAPPGSVIQIVADGVRGMLTYQLLQSSPNFAIASAEQMVAQAQQGAPGGAPGNPSPPGAHPGPLGGTGNVAQAAGIAQPGMGMSPAQAMPPGMQRLMGVPGAFAADRTLGGPNAVGMGVGGGNG